ncbi:MAG: hypothetical protein IPL90_05770 [Holophagales bacterium]|nr:hypothetical protein [Holophagales bacterium]
MKRALLLAVAALVASSLPSCGASPTESNAVSQARTTLKITVTECHLAGSVVVRADGPGNEPATLPTPGEVTLYLTPGPHSLTFQRADEVFAANAVGALDPLASIAAGGTAFITLVDPPAACMSQRLAH